jgi:hypothetical protein
VYSQLLGLGENGFKFTLFLDLKKKKKAHKGQQGTWGMHP